jgi:hypothetical protein
MSGGMSGAAFPGATSTVHAPIHVATHVRSMSGGMSGAASSTPPLSTYKQHKDTAAFDFIQDFMKK